MRNANKEITKKHDHTLTNLLKAAIFSLVMLAPIFSIAVRCGYVMFNKNAYESYYGETINQENNVLISNIDDFKLNQVYVFDTYDAFINSNSNLGAWAYIMNINNVKLVNTNATLNQNASNIKALALYYNISYQGRAQIQITYNDDQTQSFNQNINFRFYFNYISNDLNVNWAQYNYFYEVEYNNYSYLDNAFTYGISNLKNETVFNWTQNTALYQPINAMCTGLGITEEAIAIMLTYWALITAIYIIFDIVIVLFTKLTHLLN